MAGPRQIIDVEIAVANHLAALQRDNADDLAGLDPVHPAVDGLIVVHVYHQVVIILAGKRSNEAFEELLILCAQGSERHGHGGLPRSNKGTAFLLIYGPSFSASESRGIARRMCTPSRRISRTISP